MLGKPRPKGGPLPKDRFRAHHAPNLGFRVIQYTIVTKLGDLARRLPMFDQASFAAQQSLLIASLYARCHPPPQECSRGGGWV